VAAIERVTYLRYYESVSSGACRSRGDEERTGGPMIGFADLGLGLCAMNAPLPDLRSSIQRLSDLRAAP
jgi:hypothetical protein